MTAQGQTINDRILAARHSIAGQGLAKAVCKATTEEIIGPKKKHLDYLLHCTNEPNVSIPTLANLMIERTQNPCWVVVFKGLITTHHLMCYGNERFTQYLASSNSNFQLSNYLDKGGVQVTDKIQSMINHAVALDPLNKLNFEVNKHLGYDMSPFIRRYAKYLSEKSVSYRNVAFDFCKVKRGKDGGTLRSMNADKLLKTLPHLQQQIDALLEFDCTSQDLNNGVINACFMLLFRDLIRLFACYNDGIINLLEKYFEMNKKQARDALDIYKKFLIRMDRVADFLKVAENVGIDKGDIPDLAKAPSSLLEALEAHLASLEGRKPGSGGTTPTGATRVNVAAAVSTLATTSNAFGTAAASNGGIIDEKTAHRLLQEEAAAMEKFRSTASASNPFAAPPEPTLAEETPNILDLFGVPAASSFNPTPVGGAAAAANGKASDDLLQLAGNPFANMLNAAGTGAPIFPAGANPNSPFMQPNPGLMSPVSFTSENAFNNIFGQPAAGSKGMGGGNLFGEVLLPANSAQQTNLNKPKVITGDLDASLANLASNLNFGTPNKIGVPQARGPPMAGLNNFQNQAMGQEKCELQPTSFSMSLLAPSVGASGPMGASFDYLGSVWGPSTKQGSSTPGNSFFPSQNSGLGFPTSSPFDGMSSSQTFPSFGMTGLMTPSPSMPNMSQYTSPGQPFNTGFMAGSPINFNNNNIGEGKFKPEPQVFSGSTGFGNTSGFGANPGFGGTASPGVTAGSSLANDPFGGLL